MIKYPCALTNAVVAIDVSLSPALGVGAFGSPVNVGDASGALAASSVCTYAVVAICVVFVPPAAVGAAGVPVNVGDARFAFAASSVCTYAVVAICVVFVPPAAVGAVGVPPSATEDLTVGFGYEPLRSPPALPDGARESVRRGSVEATMPP